MTVQVGNAYCDVTIDPSTKELVFPDDVSGSIRPGSLNLPSLELIIWGTNMTDLIEPGVIPDGVTVILRPSYKHRLDDSQLGPNVTVWVHASNLDLAPTDRCFKCWTGNGTVEEGYGREVPQCTLSHNHTILRSPRAQGIGFDSYTVVNDASIVPAKPESEFVILSMTESVTDTNPEVSAPTEIDDSMQSNPAPTETDDGEQTMTLEVQAPTETPTEPCVVDHFTTQVEANTRLIELCRETSDWPTIEYFINANLKYLEIVYGDYLCFRELLKYHDLTLSQAFVQALGPIPPDHFRNLIKRSVSQGHLDFMLELAESMGIKAVTTPADCITLLFKAFRAGSTLDLVKRLYAITPTTDVAVATLRGSFYQVDRTITDYFFELCEQAKEDITSKFPEILYHACESKSMYALNRLLTNFKVDWATCVKRTTRNTSVNVLTTVMNICASEQTGTMIGLLADYFRASGDFGQSRIRSEVGHLICMNTLRQEYCDAIMTMCRNDHTAAAVFFASKYRFSSVEIIDVLRATVSDATTDALIAVYLPLTKPSALMYLTANDTVPQVRKFLAAYYRQQVAKYSD